MSDAPLTVVVTGPTCGGKTSLATAIARRFGWPILSLDSMKVYRRMDIGSAKPSQELRAELRIELLDLREPWERFSVSDYIEEWRKVSATIEGPRVLSGGTAFYLSALREGLFEGPGPDAEVRATLGERADREGLDVLHRRLAAVDPVAATRIHPTDRRRTIRALEVFETSGEPITVWQARRTPILDPARTLYLGVHRPRPELHARIAARIDRMFAAGWVDEVRALIAAHDPPWSEGAAQSIGYERIREALARNRDPEQEIPRIRARTNAFARRQLTWIRKMPIEWWSPEEHPDLLEVMDGRAEGTIPLTPDEDRLARRSEL